MVSNTIITVTKPTDQGRISPQREIKHYNPLCNDAKKLRKPRKSLPNIAIPIEEPKRSNIIVSRRSSNSTIARRKSGLLGFRESSTRNKSKLEVKKSRKNERKEPKRSKSASVASLLSTGKKNQEACYTSPFVDSADIQRFSVIGKGSNSKIFKCSVNGLICALKEIQPSHAEEAAQEIQILNDLPQHKNIIRFFGYKRYFLNDKPSLLFLQQHQSSLNALIRLKASRDELFTPPEILQILLSVASAIKFLHKRKIIHRDIKSHNILMDTDIDGNQNFVVADFGIAIQNAKDSDPIGTPSYMAPEMFTGEEYSYPIDVYAFGMLLFELLTLSVPYQHIPHYEVASHIELGIQPEFPQLDPVYQPLILLHKQCVNRDPQKRPTMKQVYMKLAVLETVLIL